MVEARPTHTIAMPALTAAEIDTLMRHARECTLIWNTRDGPTGAMVGFFWAQGRIWLTAADERANRLAALRRDDRVAVVVNSRGLDLPPTYPADQLVCCSVTFRGRCAIRKDAATRRWFFLESQKQRFPDDPELQENMARMLDGPDRNILCVTPEKVISFNSGAYMRDVYAPVTD